MKLFDVFKKSSGKNNPYQKSYLVDDLFFITTSPELKPIESDRFRMETESGKVQLTITNYEFSNHSPTITTEDIKNVALPLFNDFVKNGGYIPASEIILEENMYISVLLSEKRLNIYYTPSIILIIKILFHQLLFLISIITMKI